MKKLSTYEDVHKEVKVEAAKDGTSVPHMGSELLRWAIKEKRAGRCKISAVRKPVSPAK